LGVQGEGGGFDAFWAAYPRKESKQAARKAWSRLRPPAELQAAILAAVARQKGSEQWLRGVIPHPATWLNNRRWEDESTAAASLPHARHTQESVAEKIVRIREEQRRAAGS